MSGSKTSVAVLISAFLPLILATTTGAEEGGKNADSRKFQIATFAGGCFWCMEPPFDKLEGVISTTSGYTGGHKKNPTYEEVSSGVTVHADPLRAACDPAKLSYQKLLPRLWHNIDPSTPNRP